MNKIDLKHPVEVNGERITTITMRRPKVRDQIASERVGGTDAEQEVRLFSSLAEVPPVVIEEMDMADYRQLQKVYEGFLS